MSSIQIAAKQPTTYQEMLNFLLPTKQADGTTYIPRITQNGDGTLNSFDHWHADGQSHTHIGVDLAYSKLLPTGSIQYLPTSDAANSLVSVGAPVSGTVIVRNDTYKTVAIVTPSGMVFEISHMTNVDTSLNGMVVEAGTHLGTMSNSGLGATGARHVHLDVYRDESVDIGGGQLVTARVYYDPMEVPSLGDAGRYVVQQDKSLQPQDAVQTTTASDAFRGGNTNAIGAGQTSVDLIRSLTVGPSGQQVVESYGGQQITSNYSTLGVRTGGDQFVPTWKSANTDTSNWLVVATNRQNTIVQSALKVILPQESYHAEIYSDPLGIPTVGYGYALLTKSGGTFSVRPEAEVVASLRAAGVGEAQISGIDFKELGKVASDLNGGNVASARQRVTDMGSPVVFSSAEQAQNQAENRLVTSLPRLRTLLGGAEAVDGLTTNQLAALLSMYDNGPGLIGPNIAADIRTGNFPAALNEILNNSNSQNLPGLTIRRGLEGAMFANPVPVVSLGGALAREPFPRDYTITFDTSGNEIRTWTQKADTASGVYLKGDVVSVVLQDGDVSKVIGRSVTRRIGTTTETMASEVDPVTKEETFTFIESNELGLRTKVQYRGGLRVGDTFIQDGVTFSRKSEGPSDTWVDPNGLTATERQLQEYDQETQRMLARSAPPGTPFNSAPDFDAIVDIFEKTLQNPPKKWTGDVLLASNSIEEVGYWTDGGYVRTGVFANFGEGSVSVPGAAGQRLLDATDPSNADNPAWAPPKITLQQLPDGATAKIIDLGDGMTVTAVRDKNGALTQWIEAEQVGNVTTTRAYDGQQQLAFTRTLTQFKDQAPLLEQSWADGSWLKARIDPQGKPIEGTATGGASPLQGLGAFVTDINDLVAAYRSSKHPELPILKSGLKLVNDQVNPFVGGAQTYNNVPLFTTTAVVSAINSLYNLHEAFGGGGSDFAKVSAVANSLVAVNAAANAVAVQLGGTVANQALNSVANTVGQALPFVNAAYDIAHGDYAGAAVAVAAYFVPGIGWAYAAYQLISAMGSEPPEAWATAKIRFANTGDVPNSSDMLGNSISGIVLSVGGSNASHAGPTDIHVDIVGDSFGPERVRFLMEGNGKAPSDPQYFGGLLDQLNQVIANVKQQYPDAQLGIVPQRMPTLTWHEARNGDPGYALVDIDPLTGKERFPGLRYNDDWTPYNADPTDPAQRRDIFQRLIDSSLERQAIAPIWEVQTARLQQDAGDPNAGLTEEERAAKRGFGAPADANGNPIGGHFRPVILDMNGDGQFSTVANSDSSATFDWDETGYQKQTGWISGQEGFLVLDRNFNGVADSGKELFSNAAVADAAKGVRSLAWTDSNGDGKLNADDPVFAQLKVWQDSNGNGIQEAGEAKSLSDLGITEIDYGNGRFTRNGQIFGMESPDLQADSDGVRYDAVPSGITIRHTDGSSTLVVTQVSNLGGGSGGTGGSGSGDGTGGSGTGAGAGGETGFHVGDNGVTMPEDGYDTPSTVTRPVGILISQLLADDRFNGSGSGLSISAVGNAVHGNVTLDLANGLVQFTPDTNYNGPASFQYTVTEPGGTSAVGNVSIVINAVNDKPQVAVNVPSRTIFGYGALARTVTIGSGENAISSLSVTRDQGIPFYAPFQTVGGQTLTWVDQGESGYYQRGSVVDTRIPKDYYDREYDRLASHQGSEDGFSGEVQIIVDGITYVISHSPPMFAHGTPVGQEAGNDGQVSASDPDGTSSFRYELLSQGLYGTASINSNTGEFTYTGRRYVEQDALGNPVGTNVDTDDHTRSESHETDVFQIKVIDLTDPTGNTYTVKDVPVTHYGPRPLPNVQSGGKKPIAVDLNGDGFHFTNVDDSNVFFDVNGDGWRRKIAWNNPDDGFIAYDKNGDGKIDSFDEISFVPYKPDGQTDLEGLRAFDTNGDGVFSSADDKWRSFGVWQDANSNGVSEPGEFKSLDDLGIASVALTSDGKFQVINGQSVHGTAVATKSDGTTLSIADVTLQWKNVTQITKPDGSLTTAALANFPSGQQINGTAGSDLVFGTAGSDQYLMGDGNDVVNDDVGNDRVQAGGGDDLVFTGLDNDYVDAGDGNDTVFTGDGNDLALGGAGNDFLSLGAGNDAAFGGAGNDAISAGQGDDLLSGDDGDDRLFGEQGWDQLIGGAGDDQLYGGEGNDHLVGGIGADLLSGGGGDDLMEGGIGDDTYEVDTLNDSVVEDNNAGEDTVRSSVNYVLSQTIENLTLVGSSDLHGTGNDSENVLVGNDGNNVLVALSGNDFIDGGRGADRMAGGVGDDVYVVDNSGDLAIEEADAGNDEVRSRIGHQLEDNIERLVLLGFSDIDGAGNVLDNTLTGNDGKNRLSGLEGNDILRGGKGNDVLLGGSGDDRYAYARGDGGDIVVDAQGSNAIVFDAGIGRGDLRFWKSGSDLVIDVLSGGNFVGDRITVAGWADSPQGLDRIEFSEGLALTVDDSLLNHVPSADDDSASLAEDAASVSGNSLLNDHDRDSANQLHIANAGVFSGQFGQLILAADGSYTYALDSQREDVQSLGRGQHLVDTFALVTSDDGYPVMSATSQLSVTVSGANDAPVVQDDLGAASEKGTPSTSGNVLTNDHDIDHGDVLVVANAGTYQGTYGTLVVATDGSYVFSLNPDSAALRSLAEDQQASDAFTIVVADGTTPDSLQSTSSITFGVTGRNDAPTLQRALEDAQIKVLRPINVVLPQDAFADVDQGDSLTWSVHLSNGDPLPGWLAFDPATKQFSGMPPRAMRNQYLDIQVSVTDTHGARASDLLRFNFDAIGVTLTGTAGADALTGTDLDDRLFGQAGDDLLDGATGDDEMHGGLGNDTYVVDFSGDQVIESAGEGTDTVRSSIDWTLSDNVENLVLTGSDALQGTGNALDNVLTGNDAANILQGGAGNDVLDGRAGADVLEGGAGDDAYVIDTAGDQVLELAAEGFDRVTSNIDYVLTDNVEQLTLAGAARNGSGNSLDNVLFGNQLDNLLDGAAGADQMAGGLGNDRYVVDNVGDTVVESADAGVDSVAASVTYTLSANLESLALTGIANIDGSGNDLANVLLGNSGNNRLDGGAGTDSMTGGAGDDAYVVDNAGDQVIELAGQGVDKVSSSIDYVLPQHVEQLSLTGTALKATGNSLDNLLFGNDQANVIDGGVGADQMTGGMGDDRYVVDNAGDAVLETLNAGNDTVISSLTYTLAANVENLVLTGAAALNATGNGADNVLVGNSSGNVLTAGAGNDVLAGGQGSDTLDGGTGDDLYLYSQGDGRDVITDASGTDTLRFGAGISLDSVAARTIVVNGQTKTYIAVLSSDGTEQSSQGIELTAGSPGIERFEFANGSVATLADLMIAGRTLSGDYLNNVLTGDRRDDTINAGGGNDIVYARTGNDIVYGGSGADKLFGEGGNDKLYGESEDDQLWGGAGDDILDGSSGNDLLVGGTGNDQLLGGVDRDVLDAGDGNDYLNGDSGEDQLFAGAGNDTLDGGTDADLLASGDGNDVIHGGSGQNVIVAGAGNDQIDVGTGGDFIDAGAGDDVITTDSSSDFIAAGKGNDTINTGTDRDLIAFNRGDGNDIVIGSGWDRDTLTLGGGIRYADLGLSRLGNDLLLDLGQGDNITFKDWYISSGRRSVDLLQMVTAGGDYDASSTDRMKNRKVVTFDFEQLVNKFDQLRAASPGMVSWAVAGQLNTYFKSSSDTQAIGGDLSYRYATTGSYGDLDWMGVRNRMSGMNGATMQTINASSAVNPWTALQAGLSLVADQTVGLPSPISVMPAQTADELAFSALNSSGHKPSWLGSQPGPILP